MEIVVEAIGRHGDHANDLTCRDVAGLDRDRGPLYLRVELQDRVVG
jgi:hypothetical protein